MPTNAYQENHPHVLAFRPSSLPSRPAPSPTRSPDVLLGPSAAIGRVWSQIRRVAPYFRTALVSGEPGTGHAAAAHALHRLSPLSNRTFTTITPSEVEARLSGPRGLRFSAETLFFPDIEQLSPQAQQALLRLTRLRRQLQVSLIAAASGDLRPRVAAGAFSSELASALSALHIVLPPLRQRRDDIPALATHLLTYEASTVGLDPPLTTPLFLEAMAAEPWPGNLDQMQLVLRELVRQFPDAPADPEHLKTVLAQPQPAPAPAVEPTPLLKLDEVVQRHIRGVLLRCNGNKLRAAEVLGISRSTLYRMLESGQAFNSLPMAG